LKDTAKTGSAIPKTDAAARSKLLQHAWPWVMCGSFDNVIQRALILAEPLQIDAFELR